MTRASTTLIALLSILGAMSLRAQTAQGVPIGSRVRITVPVPMLPGERSSSRPLVIIGDLAEISDSTMTVRRGASSSDFTVPMSMVHRLQVSSGRSRLARAKRAAWIGIGVGAVAGFAAGDDCSADDYVCFPRPVTALAGAAVGVMVGGIIGFVTGRAEVWRETSVPARVSIAPTEGRSIALSATVRFR